MSTEPLGTCPSCASNDRRLRGNVARPEFGPSGWGMCQDAWHDWRESAQASSVVCEKCGKPKWLPTSTIASGAAQNAQQFYCACGEIYNVNGGAAQLESSPRRFRKKPVVIEALRWNGHNIKEMAAFAPGGKVSAEGQRRALMIETLEGTMLGEPGDWIIKGIKGEFYPCKPDIFEATYEPAE